MKRSLVVLLSYIMILTGLLPVHALTPGPGELPQVVTSALKLKKLPTNEALSQSALKRIKEQTLRFSKSPALKPLEDFYRSKPTSQALTLQPFFASQTAARQYAINGGSEAWAKQVYEELGVTPALSGEQLADITSGKLPLSELSSSQQDFFYQTGLLQELIEGSVVPSAEVVNSALANYRRALVESTDEMKAMNAVMNLGFLGQGATDTKAILQTAQKFSPSYDPITVRALINLGSLPAVEELARFRAEHNQWVKPVWGQFELYAEKTGASLNLPKIDVSSQFAQKWNLEQQRLFGANNPYSALFWSEEPSVTKGALEIRQDIQHKITIGEVQTALRQGVSSSAAKPAAAAPQRPYSSLVGFFHNSEDEVLPRRVEQPVRPRREIPASTGSYLPPLESLRFEAEDLGMSPETIYGANRRELAELINLYRNMAEGGKVLSRYDEFAKASGIDPHKNRENAVREWANQQPDFFPQNYNYTRYDEPFKDGPKPLTVLVINDSPEILKNVKEQAFGDSRVIVDTAKHIAEALLLLQNPANKYDVILTDYNTNAGKAVDLSMYAYNNKIPSKFVLYSLAEGAGPWLYQYNIHGMYPVNGNIRDLFPYLSNIARTGQAFPND